MLDRQPRFLDAPAAALVTILLAATAVAGQSSVPPTAWGDPDLQGRWNS